MKKITNALQTFKNDVRTRFMNDRGGVSPMVVTIGFALLLLVVLAAINPTISSGVSQAVQTVINRLQSF